MTSTQLVPITFDTVESRRHDRPSNTITSSRSGGTHSSSRTRASSRLRPPPPLASVPIEGVYKMEDDGLMQRFLFVEEIGFGNWGSVWLCYHKPGAPALPSSSSSTGEDTSMSDISAAGVDGERSTKLAVKLVHRSGTATSAARFKSL